MVKSSRVDRESICQYLLEGVNQSVFCFCFFAAQHLCFAFYLVENKRREDLAGSPPLPSVASSEVDRSIDREMDGWKEP